jgi:hypothetical protein
LKSNTEWFYDFASWTGSVSKGWTLSTKGTINTTRTTRNYTDTVKRPFPLNGYQSATTRTTSTTRYKFAIFDYVSQVNGRLYTNYPFFYAFDRSQSRLITGTATPLPNPATSLDRNAMYNTIRKKIHGEPTNLANMLGEYRETAETFLDLAQAVVSRGKSLLSHHKGLSNGRKRIDVGTTIAKNRLAYNYGIAPLAQDLGTALGELNSAITAAPPCIQGVESRKDRASNIGERSTSAVYGRPVSELIIETRFRTQWRAVMNQNALLVCLAQHGMLNPVGVAWELMPYSFVIDWWFNVGDVLQSLDNLLICDKLYALDSQSVRTYEYLTMSTNAAVLKAQPGWYYQRDDSRRSTVEIPRVVTLQYKPSLSLGHFLNGLALLYVAKGRLST